jgi:O-antigen ligase
MRDGRDCEPKAADVTVTATGVLGGFGLLSAAVWVAVLLTRRALTAHRRAAVVFGLAVTQPLVVLLFSSRAATVTGATSTVGSQVSRVGEVMNAAMIAFALTLVLFPGRAVSRSGRVALAGVWGMVAALWVADRLSSVPGSMRYEAYFALALTAIVLGAEGGHSLPIWGRRATRFVTGISIGAGIAAPHWANIAAGTNGYDRTFLGMPRLVGLAPHPNDLALVAAIGLVLEIGLGVGGKRSRMLGTAAAVACLALAQSYTADIAAALGVTAILAVRVSAYRRFLVAAAICGLALYLFWPSAVTPGELSRSNYVNTVSGRTTIWRLSIDEWRRHPVTGYGPSMYSARYLETYFPSNLQQATNGHDQFIQTLADSGLVGAAALLIAVMGAIVSGWRARVVDRGLSLALLAVTLVDSITETPLRVVGIEMIPALVTFAVPLVYTRAVRVVDAYGVDPAPVDAGFAR